MSNRPPGGLVVKSKWSPRSSGSASLETVEPHLLKGAIKFFKGFFLTS